MKVTFAGGVGEHGRNCFRAEGEHAAFLVDCGIMTGAADGGLPRLRDDQIRSLKYVFLTHSHADHTGALPWLRERGYTAPIIASRHTLEQLPVHVEEGLALEDLCPGGAGVVQGMEVRWGRSGHCAGGVWYQFSLENCSLLFSGDYTEDSLVYPADPIRNVTADLAVLDSAYGPEPRTGDEMRRDFLDCAETFCRAGQPILLPIPKYGRGLELLSLLHPRWPVVPVYGDAHFIKQVRLAKSEDFWISQTRRRCIAELDPRPLPDAPPDNGLCFLSDPQLNTAEAEVYAESFAEKGGVLLTGAVEALTGSWRLLLAKKAAFCRVPVHCSDRDRRLLEGKNHFRHVVPYHTPAWPCLQETILLETSKKMHSI
ncbi:MBL fold metallo-hydrolase [Oscillibacter sp.]|uniref:MBL fold metallo-hydrolase n=1 Tax=Oscillibacter sp. TaxID=1945593 RepID=UPI00289D3C0B|nr:MBL fold metallo-hydrolase [Oscillibacter sp.]